MTVCTENIYITINVLLNEMSEGIRTLDPDRCRPIAVGMLGSDLLLLLIITLAACEEDMAGGGPTNLDNNPVVPVEEEEITCDGFIEDCIPAMVTSPLRGLF